MAKKNYGKVAADPHYRPSDVRHPMTSTYNAICRHISVANDKGVKPDLTGRIEVANTQSEWYRLVEGTGWESPDKYIEQLRKEMKGSHKVAPEPSKIVAKLMEKYPVVLLHETAPMGKASSELSMDVLRKCVRIIEILYDHGDLRRGKWVTAKLENTRMRTAKRGDGRTDLYVDPFSETDVTYAILFEDADMAALVKLHI